jgi:sec-independent protein translocase protein TatA
MVFAMTLSATSFPIGGGLVRLEQLRRFAGRFVLSGAGARARLDAAAVLRRLENVWPRRADCPLPLVAHFPEASKMFRNPATDLIVVLIIVLLIMGPKRLPGLGKGLGQGMREFKDGITGGSKDEDEERPAITPAASTPDPAPSAEPEHAPAADRGSAEVGSERNS